jgi:hypothetical protein
MLLLFSVCLTLAAAQPSHLPQHALWDASLTSIRDAPSAGLWAAGAASGFVSHEAGHLLANYLLGNKPAWVGLRGFGVVPFFAISPELSCNDLGCTKADASWFVPGRRGMYLISTAGFTVQHITSEIALSQDAWLRYHHAPFEKGFLAFNILLSIGYALSTLAGVEDSHGDAGGAAAVAHLPKPIFATLLILPAVFDTVRFLLPDATWAVGASRGSKAAMLGVAYTF